MKVCYFIQSHKNPEQVHRLVRAITSSGSDCHILINHDFSSSSLDQTILREFSGVEIIARKKPIRRGDASILEVYLNSVNHLFESQCHFDWLICLSGQDYPIQPISKIETFLTRTAYDGFLRYWEVPPDQNDIDHKRFFTQYVCLPEWTKWTIRKVSRIESIVPLVFQWRFAMLGIRTKSPFHHQFRCYRGWYWNTLSRKCLKFLFKYLDENPELLRFYQRTLAPEESIFQTVLINTQRFNLCSDDLRYAEYPPELKGYAKLLTQLDYPAIVNTNAHFARKFDIEQDSKILDLIDQEILASTPVSDRPQM